MEIDVSYGNCGLDWIEAIPSQLPPDFVKAHVEEWMAGEAYRLLPYVEAKY